MAVGMAVGMNLGAFRDIILSSMNELERLERTTTGRCQLAAEYRTEAKQLRESSGGDLWRNAGGALNTHVAPPAELARRAVERAADLEKRAAELDSIKGADYSRYFGFHR